MLCFRLTSPSCCPRTAFSLRLSGAESECSSRAGGCTTPFTDRSRTSCCSADPSTTASPSKRPLCNSNNPLA